MFDKPSNCRLESVDNLYNPWNFGNSDVSLFLDGNGECRNHYDDLKSHKELPQSFSDFV